MKLLSESKIHEINSQCIRAELAITLKRKWFCRHPASVGTYLKGYPQERWSGQSEGGDSSATETPNEQSQRKSRALAWRDCILKAAVFLVEVDTSTDHHMIPLHIFIL